MGIQTQIRVETVRFPGRGSDYFGPCEVCGKGMAETAVFETHRLYLDGDGDLYLGCTSAGKYAHVGCKLDHKGAQFVGKDTLPRKGNLRLWPRSLLAADLARTGAAVDPAEIDAAVLADKLADPLQQAAADRASADEAMLRVLMREAM